MRRRFACRKVRVAGIVCVVCSMDMLTLRPLPTDLTELDLPSTMKMHFPDPANLLNFTLTVIPDEGMSFDSSRPIRAY